MNNDQNLRQDCFCATLQHRPPQRQGPAFSPVIRKEQLWKPITAVTLLNTEYKQRCVCDWCRNKDFAYMQQPRMRGRVAGWCGDSMHGAVDNAECTQSALVLWMKARHVLHSVVGLCLGLVHDTWSPRMTQQSWKSRSVCEHAKNSVTDIRKYANTYTYWPSHAAELGASRIISQW